ncbi:centrosome-associated protein 350 isoform X2 [Nothobranchius furzeri]|uniref:Transcript variant X2 n=1 Tax=Nothobranchius furzeri TaxID=105023 RepID=A0A9D2XIQ1_NOTFU|nr:transcript variant X2 [Nothobranchius furzeri]
MGEMRSCRRTEASLKSSAQLLTGHSINTELTAAWKSLAQSKAALRHIENHLEATPRTGVVLDSVEDCLKEKSSSTTCRRDGHVDASSKVRGGNQQSPAKSSSRSPLRNTTQDSNVRKNSSVEFREPLASYREATPPSHALSQLEAYNLQSVTGSSYTSSPPHSDRLPSQLLYQREAGNNQIDRDLDSTHSSALEYDEVRYLNGQSALDILKTEENARKSQLVMDESSPCIGPTPGSSRRGESTPSTSPGSASQRLENLKRHQPDGKLEKLKERIRRQRKHLEEAAEREKQQGQVEKPIAAAVETDSAGMSTMPIVKIRKVAAAPPAPIYKGFNRAETKIQTPDGKVWSEQDFQNLSRDISRHFPESSRSKHQQLKEQRTERSTERRPPKLIRKVHKLPTASDVNAKPVTGAASWREGQKLIKTVLGPGPKLPREEHSSLPAGRRTQTASRHHSDPHSEPNRRSRPNSTERPRSGSQERPSNHSTNTYLPLSSAQDKVPLRVSSDLLSSDIQGILDDLQLDCQAAEEEGRARKSSRGGSAGRRGRAGSGSQTRMPVSAWGPTRAANISSRGCRSASPTAHHADNEIKGQKKRHYDADAVRQYLARQQEERKRRQAEEKRAMKEEAEKRNQRLQELYKKQREVAKTVPSFTEALVAPVQKRLQETYNKLLLEDAQLGEEATQHAARCSQTRPVYQPSGESDKENKRLEVPQSPSSSDKSLNDLMPPQLSRDDMDVGDDSLFRADPPNPPDGPIAGPSCVTPSNEHLFSQLLRLEAAVVASNIKYTERPATAPFKRSQTKMSRIEALKATAMSLSNRIEKEALKFAGQAINYGAVTSADVDSVLASRTPNAHRFWAETNTPPTRNDDMSFRMHSSYNSTALPGAGNIHELRGKAHTGFTNPHAISAGVTGPTYNGFTQERNRIVGSLEMNERTEKEALRTKAHKEDTRADLHDSSAGSISEGPLLSEGSFSEDEGSPRNNLPKQDHLEAVGYLGSQRKEKQRLFEFQREAAKCPALSPPFLQHDSSRAPWEELNKGSPLSVINIFTRNAHGHVKVNERNSQRNSPPASSLHSGASPGSAVIYEDDFVSSHSSKVSEHRGSSSPSQSQHLSPGSTPNSSPLSRQSGRRKGTISDQSDTTLVEEQRNSCSPPSEDPSSDYRKRETGKSSSHTQDKSINSNDTSGETSGHSPQRPRLASPSRSPEPSCPTEADSFSGPLRNGTINPDINTSFYPNQTESMPTGELQYSPAVLQQQMAAELHYLESIEESIKQLGAVERMMGVSMAQQESVSLAQMLRAKQHLHEREIYELKIKAEREALETKLQQEENRQRVAMAHMELQESFAASQKEPLEKFQESTYKMSQQAEAARHTADAARHIIEVNNNKDAAYMDDKAESTSVATEYSLKFEESMTEDEIEERSFRSLLPSEAHRRGTLEKKSRHEEADDYDAANHNASTMSGSHSTVKNAHIPFSDGQDSFSQFTMEMVRQYMKDEEVRLQHQSSLLHLRQKALKEKTRAEMAWLEHQKKKLRDKGEDDKMPPIRKKQRGLLLKLQQEQAEIKRLQEANKAARKERQLLLKHQEEIARMRNTTLRLKECLKCAEGQTPPETPVSEPPGSESTSPSVRLEDEMRSASPSLSVSGSETSSIMQKLKKMRSHMDEKFLTKREQQLMQRRHHAEELLQWKQRLDQEEAEVRRMEKEALAVWDKKRDHDTPHDLFEKQGEEITDISSHTSHFETKSDSEKELVSEDSHSSVTTESSLNPEKPASQQLGGPAGSAQPAPASETSLASIQTSLEDYTQDFTSESPPPGSKSSLLKAGHSPAASSEGSGTTKMQLRSTSQTPSEVLPQPLDSPTATQSENISDQSDIEGRIKALKEELRRRKFMAYQLKKEQKKRHKERLKAQEASLLKQLENYNNFIEKTKAELSEELDSSPEAKPQVKDFNLVLEQSSTKPPLHGSETQRSSDRTLVDASLDHSTSPQPNHVRSASETLPEDSLTLADQNRPELVTPEQRSHHSDSILTPLSKVESEDQNIMSELGSEIQEELDVEVSSRSADEHSHHLLIIDKERTLDSQENLATPEHVSLALDEEHDGFTPEKLEQNAQTKQSKISEAEEAFAPNTDASPAVDLEVSPHSRNASSSSEHPHSPKSVASFSNKEVIMKDSDVSLTADGYHDDFESMSSSPTEKPKSKPELHDDHNDVVEEDIPEEMSQRSDVSEQSNQSEMLLDLHQHKGDEDEKEAFSSQEPSITLQQTSPLAVKDEMPGFTIGDRVLVGGFQSGTLRFKGPTRFANGFWAGVELDQSEGSNNGTYDGVVYFQCEECHGIFAPPDKIAHLPDKFELYAGTVEDEDLFFEDLPNKSGNKQKKVISLKQENVENNNTKVYPKDCEHRDTKVTEKGNQAPRKEKSHLNSQLPKELTHLISNGNTDDISLDLGNTSHALIISDMDEGELVKQNNKETTISERNHSDSQKPSSPPDFAPKINDKEQQNKDLLNSFSDKLIHNFVKDAVQQFADIKKVKEQKIKTANALNGDLFGENNEDESWIFSVKQKDDLPFFLPVEKEKLSSPELCNQPESPVLGASGQEELAKRLAELELSRELVDDFGDDQDWFDEDFGLSSRRKQQKQKEEEAKPGCERGKSPGPLMGGIVSSLGGEPQMKTPPRPELPLPLPPKLPEQPAMVVPHSAKEVEKMIYAATLEIWEAYDLGREGAPTLEHLPNPTPSLDYLGKGSNNKDQDAISSHSYRKAVFDLTWEILQEIYAEDPNTDQPQWVKPRQAKSSSIHRVKTSGDVNTVQEFVTAEVLKLYGLTRDQNQKSDWQKMLKFGRKKRDRVDHILVQELHEEEAQWVNYDEDELFVKLQLADSIFDALLKDTADAFTLISNKRAKRGTLS